MSLMIDPQYQFTQEDLSATTALELTKHFGGEVREELTPDEEIFCTIVENAMRIFYRTKKWPTYGEVLQIEAQYKKQDPEGIRINGVWLREHSPEEKEWLEHNEQQV